MKIYFLLLFQVGLCIDKDFSIPIPYRSMLIDPIPKRFSYRYPLCQISSQQKEYIDIKSTERVY